MTQYFGDFAEDATVLIPFNTFSSDDPSASITITNLVDADLKVHKDGGLTQIVTDGATIAIDYDGITGNHLITIDTSAHADYAVGSDYQVRMEGTTVDAGTINAFMGSFSIENRYNGVNVIQLGGSTQSATDLKDFADAGYDPATNKVQGVVLTDTMAGTIQTLDALDTAQDLEHAITQDLVGNISSGSGAIAQNSSSFTATSVNQTLTFAVTAQEDGVLHELTPSAGTLDGEYLTTLPDSASIANVNLFCYVASNGDSVAFQFWDWTDSSYKTELTQDGSNGTTLIPLTVPATTAYTGTGANLGQIKFRVFSDGANVVTKVAIDRLRFEYTVVQTALGFLGGAVWYSDLLGEAGTSTGIGTVSRPSSVEADARTIADANNLRIIHSLPGSTYTLDQSYVNFEFKGEHYEAALSGQDVSGATFFGANITGNDSGTNTTRSAYQTCRMGSNTLGVHTLLGCLLKGDIILAETGDYSWKDSGSDVAGGLTPSVDFEAVAETKTLSILNYQNGIEFKNFGNTGTHLCSISGNGQIIGAATSSGELHKRGDWKLTNNGTMTFVEDDNTTSIAEIEVDTGTDIPARFDGVEGPTFSTSTDSLEAIRNRGDIAWITGGGGGLTQILNVQPVLPNDIDLADTATVRTGLILINSLDDLPSTAEITPGTISIDRKAIGGTSWSAVVTDSAMNEQAGMVYFDEVFDSGTGYVEGDSIRVTFKSVSITADANTHEIADANGIIFQTSIRQTMRGTNGANTVVPPSVAQFDARTLLAASYFDSSVDTVLLNDAATSPQLVDDVWDEIISKAVHNIVGSAAKTLRQGGDLVQIDGVVSDATPTVTSFNTNLTQADTYFEDSVLVFADGSANAGIGKPVSAYLNANGNMAFLTPDTWPVTPVNGDDFVIYAVHVHTVLQIQAGLATEAKQDIIDGIVDDIKVKTEQLTFTDTNKLDATLQAAADVKAAVANKLADHTRRRSNANAESSSDGDTLTFRSELGAASKLTNKVSITGSTLTVTKSDDTTALGTQTLTSDAAADPVTGADTV